MGMVRAAPASRERAGGALEELVRRYGRLSAAVAKVSRGRASDEDVEQRVVVALWRKLESDGEEIEHPATYIYRCAIREAVRVVRQEQARAAEPLHEMVEEPPAPGGTEETLAARELAGTVARCAAAPPRSGGAP